MINSCDDGTPRAGDIIHPDWCIECKCYKKIAIFRWWDKLIIDSKIAKKPPVLIMREVGDIKDTLVTIHYTTFNELKEKAAMYDQLTK